MQQLADPAVAYRGVTLWMLNDRLDEREIERQLRGFKDAGWGAVITRTFDGLRTEYLSDRWMLILETICRVAREIGLKVWFQAGYMPNGVPDLPQQFEHRVLTARKVADAPAENEQILCTHGDYAYSQRRLPHVLDLLQPEAVKYYLEQAYEKPWFRRFGAEFGKTIEAIWVDEPCFQPPNLPWGDRLISTFAQQWGYALEEHIASLFERVGDYQKIRHHYWRTVLDLFLKGYFTEVSGWCERHGVKFAGHLMGEDMLISQIAWTAACMPAYQYMQIPGIDHLTRGLGWRHGGAAPRPGISFFLTPKQCSSVAHQLGLPDALAEMYAVSSQGITFEDRKWIGEFFAVMGINYRCMHGSFYSMRGRRKRIYAPHLSHQQPWWPDNRMVSDHFARLSCAMHQGRPSADLLVLHPIESAFCVFDPLKYVFGRPEPEGAEIVRMNDDLTLLLSNLTRVHLSFDLGDETIMADRASVDGPLLRVGKMTYRAVILPPLITLRQSTVALLESFMAAGGAVFSIGELPARVDGADEPRLASLAARIRLIGNTIDSLQSLCRSVAPAITLEGPGTENVWLNHRITEAGQIFFLANTSREQGVDATIRIIAGGDVQSVDLSTGQLRSVACQRDGEATVLTWRFAPAGSALLFVTPNGRASATRVEGSPVAAKRTPIAGPWHVARDRANALTLDFCRLQRGDSEPTPPMPVTAVQEMLTAENYQGPVTLRFAFSADFEPQSIHLVVEDPNDCDLRVNGQQVRYAGLPYYIDEAFSPIDISAQTRIGENHIELTRSFSLLRRPRFDHAGRFQNIPGVELEYVYIVGDFAVAAVPSGNPAAPKCDRMRPSFRLIPETLRTSGDLVTDGYPFFAGRITLTSSFRLDAPLDGQRVMLNLPRLDACVANVRINGQPAGSLAWHPFELDITAFTHAGDNRIEIELVNTLRNLLGPHHRPSGDPDHTWHHAYSGALDPETRQTYPKWYENRDTHLWTDDYFFVRYGMKTPEIVVRTK